ncbi:hypothetical protein L202_00952, partial [Cryptococcus amylolentus CBS 6039]
MYLLSDRPSIDQGDKLHLVGQYLKISGYFKGMSFPPKLIEDYYRSRRTRSCGPRRRRGMEVFTGSWALKSSGAGRISCTSRI